MVTHDSNFHGWTDQELSDELLHRRRHNSPDIDRLIAIEPRLAAAPEGWRQRPDDRGQLEDRGGQPGAVRCGRCGHRHTATSEDDYLKVVGAHSDAHAVWDRLNPSERAGIASILRTVLSSVDLAVELVAVADRQLTDGGHGR
ncbi:hypothetical protein [Streptomyces sp. NPDC004286]|uniref:hypothetical protein n=1 Tax=Streptomyces sp. NPDC004286 TaxID=3364696 RepID=UPI0036B5EFB8